MMRRCVPGGAPPAVFRWCLLHHRRRSAAALPSSSAAPPLDPTLSHFHVSFARGEGPPVLRWGEVTPGGKGYVGVRIGKGRTTWSNYTAAILRLPLPALRLRFHSSRRAAAAAFMACDDCAVARKRRLVAARFPCRTCPDACLPRYSLFSSSASSSFMTRNFERWPCWA